MPLVHPLSRTALEGRTVYLGGHPYTVRRCTSDMWVSLSPVDGYEYPKGHETPETYVHATMLTIGEKNGAY